MSVKKVDIKNYRVGLDISQKDFAKLIGVTTRTVQNWESGNKIPESKQAMLQKVIFNFDSGPYTESIKDQSQEKEYSNNAIMAKMNQIMAGIEVLNEQCNNIAIDLDEIKDFNKKTNKSIKEINSTITNRFKSS